ncbi:hypothetical protein [Chloracidobacterium thermophilum]|jgi:hypothetical protein|uniref:Uncharacterized protein n=1 Tax=Chloracidobacterium thermophilum (strain B) TaxID=981222 RepID=G2LIU3_CHLTF|nr:hypothetical protein [Chloracidobacterium thermophilum]AEP12311.1 hypothetical protein Cabther_A1561 [Chloracidobacterium thermophilum B]QUV78060.1 hypothetical protein J8C08_08030 [Chloracidobacterium thermophilum]
MAVHPTRLKLFLAVAGLMLLMSHALRTTILAGTGGNNPALQRPRSVETSENQTGPLSEVGFYRLVQRVRQGQITTDAAIRELRQRGITFEVTDEVLDRARQLGAPGALITALVELTFQPSPKPSPTARPQPTRTIPSGPVPASSAPPRDQAEPVSDEPSEASAEDETARLSQLPLIEQARFHALRSADDLPDFIVTQTIRRMVRDGRGQWQTRDILETEVRVEGGRERVELLSINGRATQRRYEDVGGATSVGDFSGQLAAPFLPSTNTRFREARRERYRGRLCRVYDFVVPKANSGYTLTVRLSDGTPQRIQVGYQGSLWIDEATKRVLRIEHTATDIPPGFPMSQVESAVDYDWVTILGKNYWMPLTAETIQVSDAYRQAFRNVSEFRNYRKFEGDVKIIE